MVELREPLETLVAPPSKFTAGTPFPRAQEIRLYDTTLGLTEEDLVAYALVLGRGEA